MGKIAGILGILICLSCTPLMEDVSLQFLEPLADGTLTITVRDYENKIPENVSLHFVGKDSAVVTNTLGVKKIKLSADGRFYLAIGRDILPTAKEPVYFSVRVEAPGYTPWVQELYFTSRSNAAVFARLGKLREARANVWSDQVKMEGKKQMAGNAKWVETEFNVKNGKGLNGYVGQSTPEIRIDYMGIQAGGLIPVAIIPNLYTASGNLLGYPVEFSGFKTGIFLRVTENQSKEWRSWEGLSQFRVYLSTDAQNPVTVIPAISSGLFHYDDLSGKVSFFGDVQWQKDAHGIFVNFEAKQSGYWFLGEYKKLCGEKAEFTLLTHYSDLDVQGLFKVINTQNNQVIRSFYTNLNLNSKFTVSYLPAEVKQFSLQFFDYLDYGGGKSDKPFFKSQNFLNCVNLTQSIDLTNWKAPAAIILKVEVVCPAGKTLDAAQIPVKMWAQFSVSGKENWKDLATFTRDTRTMKTYKLKPEETYDFRISTDGKATWPFRENNFKMKSLFWNYRVFADTACK
ncbi:MAG: hypothetical protein LCH67_17640 [Bacteroidetes bacterium]|nr:hypothetical protein [Bacteroidota bacterium]